MPNGILSRDDDGNYLMRTTGTPPWCCASAVARIEPRPRRESRPAAERYPSSGTESSQTHRWRREAAANSSLETPILLQRRSFGEISGYQSGVSGSIGAPRDALSGSEIKGLRIFAPYTRACTRVWPPKSEVVEPWWDELWRSHTWRVDLPTATPRHVSDKRKEVRQLCWKAKRARWNH